MSTSTKPLSWLPALVLSVAVGCVATDPPSPVQPNNLDGPNNVTNNTPNNEPNNEPNNRNNVQPVDPNNKLPVAAPGLSRQVNVNEVVTLDGTESYDPDGDKLIFTWTLMGPSGTQATLTEPMSAITRFTPDVVGDYIATLVVNDGKANSAAASVRITARPVARPNSPPTADAGVNRSVEVGRALMLDGSGSSDPDGDRLEYSWELLTRPQGSTATILGATSVMPSFTPDREGLYTIRLTVSDGRVSSTPATVNITATMAPPMNQAPTARAGVNRTVEVGTMVTLDGSTSVDPDGDALTYRWVLGKPTGSASTLQGAMSARPSFTPDIPGAYTGTLIVNDGKVDSGPSIVTVTATRNNTPPTASAGSNQTVAVGATVRLDGSSSSDPDGQTLTYAWTLTPPAGSTASLSGATSDRPTFVADREGAYAVTLVVNDGQVNSAPSTIVITATTPCLRFSEIIEGSSNNKAVEILNCGTSAVDLSAFIFCQIQNDNMACSSTANFSATLAAGQVYSICNSSTAPMPPACQGANGALGGSNGGIISFNGDDRLAIYSDINGNGAIDAGDPIVDAFGQLTVRPPATTWQDKTFRRCNPAAYLGTGAFQVSAYFTEHAKDDLSHLGTPPALSGCP